MFRLLIDPPQLGPWNMALDEQLLASAAEGQATLRFYQWSEPTMSLGYFQSLAERETHTASRDCTIVRRASGGGAILHDHELTYSIAVPVRNRFSTYATHLYDAAHDTLVETLAEWQIAAEKCLIPDDSHPQPFLCFERRASGDVILDRKKIVGSAQRRNRGAVLQHGSILLARSAYAPELPGIAELARPSGIAGDAAAISPQLIIDRWLPRLADYLRVAFTPGEITPDERAGAEAIENSKFGTSQWLARR